MSEMEAPEYPPIEPTTFDLIVIGTGLPESVISAAASSSGKTVLHIDLNAFYGSHFSSLLLPELESFLISNPTPSPASTSSMDEGNIPDHVAISVDRRPLYSDIEISSFSSDVLEEHLSRKFIVDVCGPRVLYCADKSIDIIRKSGANEYVGFKSIDASFIVDESGELRQVPDSRSAIFKDKSLSLMEKNQLMKFFKLVQAHLASASSGGDEDDNTRGDEKDEEQKVRISIEDLESPFIEFMTKMRLPRKIKSIILYAIVMADYDQEDAEVCQDLVKTKVGIERLALYQSSIGRFSNAVGAFLYPMYGQGELPQAFCRRAAVKGCIYVLQMPIVALLLDKMSGSCKGVRLASGQDIFGTKLILDPSLVIPSPSASLPDSLQERLQFLTAGGVKGKVVRAVCITRRSLKPDISNLLVVYPPQSLDPKQDTSVRALQLGSNLAVCPSGMFILYLSALCDDVDIGKKVLDAAIKALLKILESVDPENNLHTEEVKPTLLWRALYVQDITDEKVGSIYSPPMPDGNLNYSYVFDAVAKMFQRMYPDDVFFPETSPEDSEDENENGFTPET